jgi:2-oxoglutarate/2-oxoacid ferredoxin oxidoreductase subunit beta
VVEILTQCPTYFGRRNKMGEAVDMVEWFRDNTTPFGSEAKGKDPSLIERGVFVDVEKPEYCNEYEKIVEKAMKGRA